MNASATSILNAQQNLLVLRAIREQMESEIAEVCPTPATDISAEDLDAWSDAYEDERAARGGDKLDAAIRAAESDVLAVVGAWIRTRNPSDILSAALSRVESGDYRARVKFLDLCMRLDARTVA